MEKLSFNLVQNKKTSKFDIGISQKFFWIGLGGVLIFSAIILILEKYININLDKIEFIKYAMYGLIISMLIGTIYRLFEFNGNNRTVEGFITFDENEITINNARIYNLREIKNLRFKGYDYKGRAINLMSNANPTRSYGGDNFVEFNYLNKEYKYQFVVNSKTHRKLLMEKAIPKMKLKTDIKY